MASVSMLQRRLKLGYSRAARLVDQMEEKGVVGPFEGSKPRQVLITKDQWQEMQFKQGMVDAAPEPVPDELEFEGDAIPQSRDLPRLIWRIEHDGALCHQARRGGGEAAVHAGLRAYNRTFVSDTADLSLVVEDGAGQIIGGCDAFRMGELALRDVLWVPESRRGTGLGPASWPSWSRTPPARVRSAWS